MYTTNNPSAWITKGKGRRSIKKNNIVYLKDNDEFEIELYNPKKTNVLAKIKINGNFISNAGIVLRPAERLYLDRFIDTDNKLKFSTYEVEDTLESKIAISNNGLVEVYFYDETIITPYIYDYNYYKPIIKYGPYNHTVYYHSVDMSNVLRSSSLNTTSSNVCLDSLSFTTDNTSKSIETGRIEEGSKSDQEFTYTTGEYQSYACASILYHIKPESTQPKEVHNLVKYCTHCGKKSKKNDNFCSDCGTKL